MICQYRTRIFRYQNFFRIFQSANILRRILLKREETEQSLVLDIVRYPLSIKSTKAMSSMGGYFVNWKLPWRNSVVKNGRFELLSKSLWRKDGI